ncbi:MAG: hypothetical protein J0M12_01525 [Deltaproteobacteria bacterium]|nr:hypothetical protein [Deltaproteobacteria bacterium]
MLFKPSGSAFQELACVTLKLGERQEILCLELILSRSFVDDPRQGVFAADIAKSFIRGAFGAHATAQIQELADDIEFRARSVAPMLSAGSPRGSHTLARPPSPGFLVYQGATPQIELGSTHAKLRLGNHGVGQESRLVLYAGS